MSVMPATQIHYQVPEVIAAAFSYDTVSSEGTIAAGTLQLGKLPANAFVLGRTVHVTTAFAATTTNVLTIGTVSGTANDIVTAGDVNETVTGVNHLSTPLGVLNSTQPLTVYAYFTGAGAANTAGAASFVMMFYDFNKRNRG